MCADDFLFAAVQVLPAGGSAHRQGTLRRYLSGADRGCGAVQSLYGFRAGIFIGAERDVLQSHRMASAPDV